MTVANVIEWIKCEKCGRRQRWKAELVGTTLACPCGTALAVPAVELSAAGSGAFDPEDTLVDPSLTNEAAAITEAPPKLGDDLDVEDSPARTKAGSVAGKKVKAPAVKITHYGDTPLIVKAGGGMFGMNRQTEMAVFGGLVVLAFIMVVHALIVQWWPYIALSVLLVPLALWKFIPSYKRWRGNRSFKRAWAETFAGHDEPGA